MPANTETRTKWREGDKLPAFSSTSEWEDEVWSSPNLTHGASKSVSSINWRFPVKKGEVFTESTFDEIRFSYQALVWTLFNDRRVGKNLKPGSLGQVAVGIRYLAQAMTAKGIWSFEQITPALVDSILTERANRIVDQEGDDALTEGRLNKIVSIFTYIWEQWNALAEFGIAGPREHPLRGLSAQTVAQSLSRVARGHIKAFGDEESIPILEAAWKMITVYVKDVQKVQDKYVAETERWNFHGQSTKRRGSAYRAIRNALEAFEFERIDGASEAWHGPLVDDIKDTHRTTGVHFGPSKKLRALILNVGAAAQIILQGTTGMRTSEICGLKNGWRNGMPACVDIEKSIDGMLELFYISGTVSKDEPSPQATRWIVGCRPTGSNFIPAPVQALITVQKLFEPWYRLSGIENIFVSFINRRGIPYKPSSIAPILGTQVARAQKEFIFEFVNNRVHERGQIDLNTYRPHRWRKTFAFFVFRTDPSLLRAISTHFKHMSVAMTEQGYIGTDQFLLEDINNARQKLANDFFAQAIGGQRQVTGPFSKHIEKLRKSLNVDSKSGSGGDLQLANLLDEHKIRVNYSPHGKCLVSLFPEQSRCKEILGENSWSSEAPNFTVREPNVCLSCKCFAIDHEHLEYWQERLRSSTRAYDSLAKSEPCAAQLFKMRANKAKAVLNSIRD